MIIQLVDTAKEDIRQFIPDPAGRVAFMEGMKRSLSFMPGRLRACPPFGPNARFYREGCFTVVFDLLPDGEVWVRHVWPAKGEIAAKLFERG